MPFIIIAGKSADSRELQVESCRRPEHVAFAITRFLAMGLTYIIITDGNIVYTPDQIKKTCQAMATEGAKIHLSRRAIIPTNKLLQQSTEVSGSSSL